MKKTTISRPAFAGALMLLCAAGLLIRRTYINTPDYFNSYFPDIAWTMALYCAIGMTLNRGVVVHLPLALVGSYLVEYSQTLDFPLLNTIRANRFGALLLGSDFLWSDMICYTVGAVLCAIAELCICFVMRRRTPPVAEAPEPDGDEIPETSETEAVLSGGKDAENIEETAPEAGEDPDTECVGGSAPESGEAAADA